MSDKVRFSPDEDDIIIEFVRKNPCLYNKRIHDKQLKIRLWKDLADKLNKDGECVVVAESSHVLVLHFYLYTCRQFCNQEMGVDAGLFHTKLRNQTSKPRFFIVRTI